VLRHVRLGSSTLNLYTFHYYPPLGYPPMNIQGSFDSDTPPTAARYLLPSGILSEYYFGYVKKWWPYRNDANVLLLHYSNVRRDLRGYVEKIASFLGVVLTEEELVVVTERCSIDHMKKANKFNYLMPLNTDKRHWDVGNGTILNSGTLVNKGEIGSGRLTSYHSCLHEWS